MAQSKTDSEGGLQPARVVGTIPLRDGRDLGFAEFADPTGLPVVWLHGTPGSCRQVAPAAIRAAERQGLRIIGIARPGAGASTKAKYENIASFADDAEQLADHLGLDRFGVVGLSGGGPYALSLGARLGHRVAGIAVLGGVSPTVGEDDLPEGGAMKLAERFEPMLRYAHTTMASTLNVALRPLLPAASFIADTLFKYLPEGDRKVFETPGVKDMLIGDLALSITQGNGLHAMMQDVALFGRDWGFRLADVKVPVSWWHGDDDWCVPLEHGQWAVAKLPEATFYLRPGDSHLSGYAAADEVIDVVAGYLAV